jgi:hypothetical protein
MIVSAKLAALKGIKFHEFALRFLFGGFCTVAAASSPAASALRSVASSSRFLFLS